MLFIFLVTYLLSRIPRFFGLLYVELGSVEMKQNAIMLLNNAWLHDQNIIVEQKRVNKAGVSARGRGGHNVQKDLTKALLGLLKNAGRNNYRGGKRGGRGNMRGGFQQDYNPNQMMMNQQAQMQMGNTNKLNQPGFTGQM